MSVFLALMLVAAEPLYGTPSEPLAVQAIHNYGICVAERSPRSAVELLGLDFRTDEYGDRLRRFAEGHGYCVPGGRLAFSRVLFAGALAERLLETRHSERQLPAVLASTPNPPLQARDQVEMMALCTVRQAPTEVANLLEQPVTSDEEAKAVKALAPTLEACLAKDQTLQLNRPGLRSILALAAWRIANGSGN